MTPEAVLEDVSKKGIKFISMQFTDIFGTAKNIEINAKMLLGAFADGVWFDGSSIEGFVRIYESDMLLKPDAATYAQLPWAPEVARLICDVYTTENKPFEGDPRYVLKRALAKAEEKGFEYKTGPELEFFLFHPRNGEIVPKTHDNAGYFDLAPNDLAAEIRRATVPFMAGMGIEVEAIHHEVAPGQHEIDFKYGNALYVADSINAFKTIVKMVAKQNNLFASFMPKPISGINGSGMHVHQSLWKDGKNAFFGSGKYDLSESALSFVAGQLNHARAFCGVIAPNVNSYKRLVPGYEAPIYICWAKTNRSALIRIPKYAPGKVSASRCELRCPDPSCNPYLAFAVMLEAGMDGMEKGMKPPEPVEENLYDFDDDRLKKFYVSTLPRDLHEAKEEMKGSQMVQKALGAHVFEKLCQAQRQEWNEYKLQVSPWEVETYLPRI
ncbi:type I glutamate--ammonia ligase [Candidatus Micrarchaeota archaeon CG11_big_fil_rev_8_21_14_0_20_47_5]|nr:MAG: type I glutamate--ammonia ligase [Candidatus Micrarchaeota archaeon CG11_big_fil_rev_8_21_14_0_20_47_5]